MAETRFKVSQQSSVEIFLDHKWIFYIAQHKQCLVRHLNSSINSVVTSGIAFAYSPHTRLMLNGYGNRGELTNL